MTFSRTVVLTALQLAIGDNLQRISGKIDGVPGTIVDVAGVVENIESAPGESDGWGMDIPRLVLTIAGRTFNVRSDVLCYTVPRG